MITANPLEGPRKPGSSSSSSAGTCRLRPWTVGRVQIRGRGVIRQYAENGPAG